MNPVILTLFGEEYAPPPPKKPAKKRTAPKEKEETQEEEVVSKEKKTISRKKKTEVVSNILQGWEPQKQYYTIGEVATLFKVNTSHIRFWTKEFNLKVRTTRKGDRLYTPEQVYELQRIYHLVKERGFTLAGAKAKLKEKKTNAADSATLKQSLLKLKDQLLVVRKQLDNGK
jgi:DNA-binding transcriptional MerR regulator